MTSPPFVLVRRAAWLILVGLLLLAAPSIDAAADTATAEDPTIVTILDEPYRLSDLRAFVAARPPLRVHLTTGEGLRQLVDEFIDAMVFRREGERLALPMPSGVEAGQDAFYFESRARLVPRCSPPSEEEARAAFEADPARFATPPFVRVSRLLWSRATPIEGRAANAYLAEAAEQIRRGELDFAMLLDTLVGDSTDELLRQGDLGFVKLAPVRQRTDPLEQALAEAPVGALLGPIDSDGYLSLLQVTDRREPILPSWPAARSAIERELLATCRARALAETRSELFARYRVEVNEETVSALRPVTAPPVRR
ncbi:hypothetical protein ABC977_04260 [Thioalkalicoccus limnaeus]|uniref:peptidylprolyl isomerase n=1 Tax=Thioalkalicoccus limnaeus TaxID=120681 RepID=A0ABV4BDP0_9GAMM